MSSFGTASVCAVLKLSFTLLDLGFWSDIALQINDQPTSPPPDLESCLNVVLCNKLGQHSSRTLNFVGCVFHINMCPWAEHWLMKYKIRNTKMERKTRCHTQPRRESSHPPFSLREPTPTPALASQGGSREFVRLCKAADVLTALVRLPHCLQSYILFPE